MSALHLTCNRGGFADVQAHLLACDSAFTPPLASRVVISDYAERLVARAERFEAWSDTALIGLVALYCDAPDRREAFVTSVSVVPEHHRCGLGRRLMDAAVAHTRDLGFARLALQVDRAAPALGLYRALGFVVDEQACDTLHLSLDLQGGTVSRQRHAWRAPSQADI